jgi:vancomycin aglycone glucosyltransferase
MRVLLAAMGSRGDVQPMLALACALRERRHEVLVSASSDFAGWAGELGLPFVSTGENAQEWLRAHWRDLSAGPRSFMRTMKTFIDELFPAWFATTAQAAQGVEMIVSANQFAARSVAEKFGLPLVGVAYSPTLFRSSYHTPMFLPWQGLPRWLNRLLWATCDRMMWGLMKRYINAGRAQLQLAPVGSVSAHLFAGLPYMLASDARFAPAPPDWQRFDVTMTGPWFYDDPLPLAAEVSAFLDAGPAPIYIGFGSMISNDAASLTQTLLDAAGGHRLLLSAGWAGIGAGSLPSSVKVVNGPMPHAKLFPRVAAVVHHGGAGTTAAAMRAGVPQVVVPHLADQFYNAHRLVQLGLAPPGIRIGRLNAERLGGAIAAALALPAAPRIEMATRLSVSDGLARAVAIVEACGPRPAI